MEELRKGMELVLKHNLTVREVSVILLFIDGEQSSISISTIQNTSTNNTHALLTRLKLKGLIKETRIDNYVKYYELNL